MATRGTIALEFADGTVGAVYCHWDNYLSGTGQTLLDHWMDPFKVRELIDGGDLSSLGTVIGEVRPFDNPHHYGTPEFVEFENRWGSQCLFYRRDRGETDVDARRYTDWEHYVRAHQGEEYDYVLRRDGQWWVRYDDIGERWIPLIEAMTAEMAEELHQ